MICPMVTVTCFGERCAWWKDDLNCCAITTLADMFCNIIDQDCIQIQSAPESEVNVNITGAA